MGGGGDKLFPPAKKSNFEVDVGTTWSNLNRLATPLVRISFSSPSGGEVGVGFMWVYTKQQSTKVPRSTWKGPKGFAADPVYGRAQCLPMLGSLKT